MTTTLKKHPRDYKPHDINQLIDDAINALADDKADQGIDCLMELAELWKTADLSPEAFANVCRHIEDQAVARTDAVFIRQKIVMAIRTKCIGSDLIIKSSRLKN